MNQLKFVSAAILPIAISLHGCAGGAAYNWPLNDPQQRPLAFHDTRLQFAMAAGENDTLAQDFGMKLPPSTTERIIAGAALPFALACETAFWPFATGIKALAPAAEHSGSTQ